MTYEPEIKRLASNIAKVSIAASMQQCGNISNAVGCSFSNNMVERYDLLSARSTWKRFVDCEFDGKYAYFVAQMASTSVSTIVQYNTTLPINETASWTYLDLTTLNASWIGLGTTVFDGRYLYMLPYDVTTAPGTVVRYDTSLSFSSTASWTGVSLSMFNTSWVSYGANCFDGKYIYLFPTYISAAESSTKILRYDTSQAFEWSGSWTSYDIGAHGSDCIGISGASYDGRYVYAITNNNGTNKTGKFIRFDTSLSFSSTASWTIHDLSTINVDWVGFYDMVFDSRFIYFIPLLYDADVNTTFVRYDTNCSFTSSTSYESYDILNIDSNGGGYFSGIFDGRYLYAIPYYNGLFHYGGMVRYDTFKPFNVNDSWSVVNLSADNLTYRGFRASCFDGRNIYVSPCENGTANGTLCRVRVKPFNIFQEYQQ